MKQRLNRRPSFLLRLLVSATAGFVLGGAVVARAESPAQSREEEASEQSAMASGLLPSLIPTLVTCPFGELTTTYSPGITYTPRTSTVSVSGRFSCLTLSGEAVSSATVSAASPPVTITCANLLSGGFAQTTLTWNTGETSVLALNVQKVELNGTTTVQTFNGVVASGKFFGANVVRAVTYLTTDLSASCSSPNGLTQTRSLSTTMALLKPF
ncbi:hypothetical protein OV207_32095 [Corallococcus sp. BB11-1]|uniref:hypothetical protein n=1 Tax=Corallococcus sp. BB11-1 TaxID=2996783 RepID=UPI0022714BFB|nr:hypothetical protein [Corallococcus sp. BB11-1]MCY1036120.1 hypothetical protein [Corallococcus sp. BB11-1]